MRADYKKKTGKDFDKDLKDKKLPEYLQVEFAKKRNRYFKLSAPKSDAAKYVKKDSYGNVVYNYDPASFGETRIMEITNTFMTAMVEYGYYPGLYTNNNYLYNL